MTNTDSSLIRRVGDLTDQESWREFVELYEPLLFRYVRSRGLSDADSRDVVQNVFISLLNAMPKFFLDHHRGKFRTWLYQVTINRLCDFKRQEQSRARTQEGYREGLADTIKESEEPDAEWLAAYRRRILEVVLPKIQAGSQERTWHCFEQHVLLGRPTKELAGQLGITANAVCVNAGRVLEKVRHLCADYMENLDDDQA